MLVTSEAETSALAHTITAQLKGGDIMALSGDLGAGKTTFTKGIAAALGITKTITSPTFAIMNVYDLPKEKNGIKTLIHIDAYRLNSPDEIRTIGAEDYLGEKNVLTVVEWPEKIQSVLDTYEVIQLQFAVTEAGRQISGSIV